MSPKLIIKVEKKKNDNFNLGCFPVSERTLKISYNKPRGSCCYPVMVILKLCGAGLESVCKYMTFPAYFLHINKKEEVVPKGMS